MAHDFFGDLTGWDLEGFHQGGDTELWKRLGSHAITIRDDERGSVDGVRFAVWAPNARRVLVLGDWNGWHGDDLQLIPGSGVWGRFIEGIPEGAIYKFKIETADGRWIEKTDPMGQFFESAPGNSAIVHTSRYAWNDEKWMEQRRSARHHQEPMSVYEVHLGGWRRGLTYLELAEQLVEYVTWQGYTHVELMPVSEFPFEGSWGYQVTGYFAPTSRFGRPDEFRHLIDRLHQAGIGVILDWVPGHFPKDEWALGRFDGTALYEHSDPRQGEHMDWGTYIFNYGRNEVKSFLVSNALYWLKEFHIDGLRVDAVASMLYLDYSRKEGEWVPNQFGGRENLEAIDFLRYVNKHVYEREPGIMMIAEESTSFPGVTRPVDAGGLGFGFKWNMGWMNDSLRYMELDPFARQWNHHLMTFAMVYAYSENYILPISHDEVVHGKGSMINKVQQDDWRKFATTRAFYAYMWAFPGKKLLFMGNEFAQREEFNESTSLSWHYADSPNHRGMKQLFHDMNHLYRAEPPLWQLDSDPSGFEWLDADDAGGNTFSWVRKSATGDLVACLVNFSPNPKTEHVVGLPRPGTWTEILNTDSYAYDGTGQYGNYGRVIATEHGASNFPAHAQVCIPPLGAIWLKWDPAATAAELQ
ncbi:1,4-alpha-glucan branching protein GlgB [Aestuariimicrobium sp. p3-SID1156]|uniref:1,4-alpha-glucan branching protein GlgB n=1 Tax=Aestuariimicrobium sp. p3-SID1156 TaxID=2916038 RepID=UPI00223A926E|nr:1,4-alpha-glucan branching protein GlgB [Aestuariimicrobium sp. p3-SID1156]MCT1459465.1 1,4-alpha-glucan branching protein GlgB [Aestuariimicrobium sp. p3-SID1156]